MKIAIYTFALIFDEVKKVTMIFQRKKYVDILLSDNMSQSGSSNFPCAL